MSKNQQDHFLDQFRRAIQPTANREEPDIWFRELRVLDELSTNPAAERQRIVLHRGFNILWAAPEDPDTEQGLYRDGLAGHASGKTLFCRILRHLLGEKPFGTSAQRDGIARNFLKLWAVASIRVAGVSWVVGRPLAADGTDFAVRADTIDAVLSSNPPVDGFPEFLVDIRALGKAVEILYPGEGWRHLLPWLARDQEARFSSLAAWREATSEGDNPQTKVIERHQLMRAVLGLLDLREPVLRKRLVEDDGRLESGRARLTRLESELAGQLSMAAARAGDLLGGETPSDNNALLIRLQSLGEVIRNAVTEIEKRPEPQVVNEARKRQESARDSLREAESELNGLAPRITELKARQNRDLTLIRNIRTGNVEDPAREAGGFCPHSIQTAIRRQCVTPASPSDESTTSITELENQAALDLAEIARLEARLKRLRETLPELKRAVDGTFAALNTALKESTREISALIRRAERADEVERLFKQTDTTRSSLKTQTEGIEKLVSDMEGRRDEIAGLRGEMDAKLQAFSSVFADIVRAVMGASVEPKISITNEGIVPHVTRNGELSGAALDTIKTLAFDLAVLAASIEGQGSHPRFLIHDGPREGDMARIIYERFFIYAAGLEGAFATPDHASFQYIITTTTPPPKTMRQGSRWLLEPVLDSRKKGQRLLKEDF